MLKLSTSENAVAVCGVVTLFDELIRDTDSLYAELFSVFVWVFRW